MGGNHPATQYVPSHVEEDFTLNPSRIPITRFDVGSKRTETWPPSTSPRMHAALAAAPPQALQPRTAQKKRLKSATRLSAE